MQQRPQWLDELLSRIDRFENKLNKLDQINKLVTSLNSKVTKLENTTKALDDRFGQIESKSVCLEYKEKGSFLVCGDLNSRIGEIDDVLLNDNLDLNLFLHHPSDVNRKAYVISRNNYNKMKQKAQFKYKRRKGIELCDLASTEPRKFWSSIKRKVNYKCKIINETMMKHIESILGDSSLDLCEEVRNLIDNTVFDDINVTQLDSEITVDEVIASIKKNEVQ
ncbi:unnamed protein product [Mytilus coruscus]|uniref:Uncharacterized protein n=1 Tax=Mytilus coruscus TaxID=42192 RepID=A0A6J8C5S0_MYTCO|nr:unnamed protein product [Mytilus coruscus]